VRGEAGLLADIDALAIPFAAHEHVAVFTVAESEKVSAAIPGAHSKNLFLKDAGGAFWLVTVPAEARVDLKALPDAIGCKRVSFGKPEDMERLLGIQPGSVTPLAAINAPPGEHRRRARCGPGRCEPRQRSSAAQYRDAGARRGGDPRPSAPLGA